MSKIAEVIKIFNLEFEQKFRFNGSPTWYKITKDGIVNLENPANDTSGLLEKLILGDISIEEWKPRPGETYWLVRANCKIDSNDWSDTTCDYFYYALGNCYPTRTQAYNNIGKWSRFFENYETYHDYIAPLTNKIDEEIR